MAFGDYGMTTELEAVNICLGAIGEQPVSEIGEGVSKSTIAQSIIYELSREIQLRGLACNTDTKWKLEPDSETGEIELPNSTLSLDPTYAVDNKYVERGDEGTGKLYDTKGQTFDIGRDIYVDIIWFLPFTDLPQHVRRYVTVRSARVFQKRFLADESLHRFTQEDEYQAKAEFERKELSIADITIFQNPYVNPRVHFRG
ncbi:MAG: hypothetical protein E3J94_04920 [Desulfobacteraceae bacterium]|nr:MAG: hypothetical protein E3J94_04920 [Desulfobacteraceae bacterium]